VATEAALRSLLESDPDVVSAPMLDLVEAGGKRLRPALVLLAGRAGEYDRDRLLPAAIAVELTHVATLVHDDVIDRAELRRGRPTVSARLGDEPAIVIGDFYFAKAYEQAAATRSAEVVAILARAVMEICAGEVRQQAIRFHYTTGRDEYMQRIHSKTATLLAACCDIGALLGNLGEKARAALHAYGSHLGVAFQIADDVLDYTASEDEIGKPIGHDLVEGFATLPLMLALEDRRVSGELRRMLVDGSRLSAGEARRVVQLVMESDAARDALARARELASLARDQLAVLPESEATRTLESLTDYVVSRKF
jgi:heptaprenyl diphosphate synthase